MEEQQLTEEKNNIIQFLTCFKYRNFIIFVVFAYIWRTNSNFQPKRPATIIHGQELKDGMNIISSFNVNRWKFFEN